MEIRNLELVNHKAETVLTVGRRGEGLSKSEQENV